MADTACSHTRPLTDVDIKSQSGSQLTQRWASSIPIISALWVHSGPELIPSEIRDGVCSSYISSVLSPVSASCNKCRFQRQEVWRFSSQRLVLRHRITSPHLILASGMVTEMQKWIHQMQKCSRKKSSHLNPKWMPYVSFLSHHVHIVILLPETRHLVFWEPCYSTRSLCNSSTWIAMTQILQHKYSSSAMPVFGMCSFAVLGWPTLKLDQCLQWFCSCWEELHAESLSLSREVLMA